MDATTKLIYLNMNWKSLTKTVMLPSMLVVNYKHAW